MEVQTYLQSVDSFENAVRDYRRYYESVLAGGSSEKRIRRMQAYRKELDRMYEELQEQAQDISNSGTCLSSAEIARELNIPEFIVKFKYEAMAVRNYNIPAVELPEFEKVFAGW